MQTKDNIINFLKENKQEIQKKYDVNKIGLFEIYTPEVESPLLSFCDK